MSASFQNFITLSTSNGMMLPLNQINMNSSPQLNKSGGDFTVVRKKQRVTPLGVSNSNALNTMTSSNVKRSANVLAKKKVNAPAQINIQPIPDAHQQQHENIPPPMSARIAAKMPALPVSVARRNARERNRVKQVNNGFAALRERIPDDVAEVFETQGNGRGSVKKLSKVETLRMAVEYIRSLEQCLADDGVLPQPQPYISLGSPGDVDSDFNCSASLLNTTTPPPESEFGDDNHNLDDPDLSDIAYLDSPSNAVPSVAHQQGFIRLPTGGTFQISTPNYDHDDEAGRPAPPPFQILDPTTGYLHHISDAPDMQPMMSPAASISSHSYDEQSPVDIKPEPCYVIVTPQQQQQQLMDAGMAATVYYTTDDPVDPQSPHFDAMLHMKTELVDDEDSRDRHMTEQELADSMIGESLQWWQKSDQQRLLMMSANQ